MKSGKDENEAELPEQLSQEIEQRERWRRENAAARADIPNSGSALRSEQARWEKRTSAQKAPRAAKDDGSCWRVGRFEFRGGHLRIVTDDNPEGETTSDFTRRAGVASKSSYSALFFQVGGEWLRFGESHFDRLWGPAEAAFDLSRFGGQLTLASLYKLAAKCASARPLYRSCRLDELESLNANGCLFPKDDTSASQLDVMTYYDRLLNSIANGAAAQPFVHMSADLEVAAWWSLFGIAPLIKVDARKLGNIRLWDFSQAQNREDLLPKHSKGTQQRTRTNMSAEAERNRRHGHFSCDANKQRCPLSKLNPR